MISETGRALTDSKGFTLLELVVVLVLISIATALVAPRLTAPLGNLQVKTATKKIAGLLRYARSLAAGEKTDRVCVFDFETQTVTMALAPDETAEAGETPPASGRRDVVYALPKGVRLEQAVAGGTAVDSGVFPMFFYANGSSSGGDVVISGGSGRAFLVHVDFVTGMVEIARPSSD